MSERKFINNLTSEIDFSGVGGPRIGEEFALSSWAYEADILNSSENPNRSFTLVKGLAKIDLNLSPNSATFCWDSDVRDVLTPGSHRNYAALMGLVLEELPIRMDTKMRSREELRSAFGTHSIVSLSFGDGRESNYVLGNPIDSQKFQNDFVFGEGVNNIQVIGKDRIETYLYSYVLAIRSLSSQHPQMELILPTQPRRWDEDVVSWPHVLEWLLNTHKERPKIEDPLFDAIHLGGIVQGLINSGNPPSQNTSKV